MPNPPDAAAITRATRACKAERAVTMTDAPLTSTTKQASVATHATNTANMFHKHLVDLAVVEVGKNPRSLVHMRNVAPPFAFGVDIVDHVVVNGAARRVLRGHTTGAAFVSAATDIVAKTQRLGEVDRPPTINTIRSHVPYGTRR